MNGQFDLRFAEGSGIDRELAFALLAESMSETDRVFGHAADGRVLERYALEVAIAFLSRPARVKDYRPALAVPDAGQSLVDR